MDTQNSKSWLKELWSPRLSGLLLVSILLLSVCNLFVTRSLATLKSGDNWVVHREQVRVEIGNVLQLLTDVETAERGYALTVSKQFLEPYNTALPQLPMVVARLRQLISDNPTQLSNETVLEKYLQRQVNHCQRVIQSAEKGDLEAARTLITGGEGKRWMDAVRSITAKMQGEETRLLELRRAGNDQLLHNTQVALWTTDALAIVLLFVIAYSIVRYGARARRSERTLATTLRSVGDAVISTDAAGAVHFMNAVAEHLTGWDQKSARGRPLDEVFHIVNEQTRAAVESPASKVLREGTVVGLANHTVLIARDGTERPIEDSGAPITDGAELVGVVLVFRDATTERAAQRALMHSEERFRAAINAVEGILWTNNAAGEMVGEQPAWAALTGQAESDYQGYGWAKSVHPDDAQPTVDAWNMAVAERKPFFFEHRVRRHDGEWRTFSIRAVPIITENGVILEWVGLHTDITIRKAVQVEQARLVAIVEQSRDFIGYADLAIRPLFLNPAGRRMIGLPDLESVRAAEKIDYFTPQSQAKLLATVLPAVKEDGYWGGELNLRNFATGAAVPVFYTLFAIRDVGAGLIGYGTVTRDLSASKRTAVALRASEARLKAILEAAPVGIVIAEAPSGKIVEGNRQVEEMLGHPLIFSSSVEDYSAWICHHSDGRRVQPHEYPLARAIAGEERPELEVCYERGDGRKIWVRFIGAPIYSDGHITGAIMASLDIDRETRTLQELGRTQQELEARVKTEVRAREAAQAALAHAQRLEALGQLAGGIAHDFNNVLQSVAVGLSLIQKRAQNPDDVRKFARMAGDAAMRGASVTSRLLAFARKSELRAVPISVRPLLENLQEILATTLGANFKTQIEIGLDVSDLQADRAQLDTVMINLAINSRDAMPQGGTLTLSAHAERILSEKAPVVGLKPGEYVRLELVDTGTGMDALTLARASEPFFTTKGPNEGTGLGLAMARGFAQQSGGALAISSTLGQGTTVTLWFPRAIDTQGESAPNAGIAPSVVAALVLVVDDDTLVRELLARELEELGYQTRQAWDGLSALAVLDRGEPVDLLITDYSMPGMNGLVLAQEARQRRPLLPVLLLTGYADANVKLDIENMHDDTVILLRKPLSGDNLAQQTSTLLLASRL